ncbi:class IV adenylate cyclase [Anaerococcus sp. AGMB09787]|uniref:class IV adenylate cyclase n=1 Tax=Anaerococcus sp. AGMB09787 TaxID=2922869 RepID=UPI001FAEF6D8|nr:class IV adenylate cyclase [Anaerococcus sp. AGMB09787]
MQREIEVKVLNIDIDEMKEKLESHGAKLINHEFQKNYTFKPAGDKGFDNGYLRLRETTYEDKAHKDRELTFKEVKEVNDVRINNEYTVNIDSVTMMIKIFQFLGVELEYEGHKERISYSYKGQRFDIDIWDDKTYPDPYMEIEFTNQSKIDEIIDDLDIDRSNVTNKSITELRESL